MSSADAARQLADRLRRELHSDAIRLHQELFRLILGLSEGGARPDTRSIAQQAADLDRDTRYLAGLTDGLNLHTDAPGHRHDFAGDEDECTWPGCEMAWSEFQAQRQKDAGP